MKRDLTYLSADGKTNIHAIEWIPEGEVRAVLQICHGMVEFIDRYDDFASYLNGMGFYVTGNDHLGHGLSVQSDDLHGYFSEKDGNKCVISDIHSLRKMTQEKYPGKPYFMLGHSMGSFLIRQYIEMYGSGLSGVIIMGTGTQSPMVLKTAKFLCRRIAASKGWKYRSAFLNNLATGGYNKAFKPARTSADWLTKDTQIVDKYLTNPWCTFVFTLNAYYNMFLGIEYMQDKNNIAKVPKDLPLFLVSGDRDPVGSFGKGVRTAYDSYLEAGMKNVRMKLYKDDRHEILNELDRKQVYKDLSDWLVSLI